MIVLLGCFFGLLLIGAPISIALALASFATMTYMGVDTIVMTQKLVTGMDSLPLLAIPGFLLAGEIMTRGGLAKRLIDAAYSFIGHVRNGLSYVTIAGGMFFSAMNGTAAATTAAIAELMVPEMKKYGYPAKYTAGLSSVIGPLGPIIPPSVIMIVYAVGANLPVGDLFLAGVVPGIMLGFALMIASYFMTRKMDLRIAVKCTWKDRLATTKDSIWALLTPIIILGGIYGGFCTPTEAAVIAVFYSTFIGVFVHKELNLSLIIECLRNTVHSCGMILLIIGAAAGFGWMIAVTDVNTAAAELILSISTNPGVVMALIIVALMIIGLFLDTVAAIVVFQTVFIPIALSVGIDPLHFAGVFIICIAIGNTTPPFGYSLFVAAKVANIPLEEVSVNVFKFVAAMGVVIVLIAIFPELVTWLPNSMK